MSVLVGGTLGIQYPNNTITSPASINTRFSPHIITAANGIQVNKASFIGDSGVQTPLGIVTSENLTFVGAVLQETSSNSTTLSLTGLSGGIGTSPQAGDIVIGVRGFKSATDQTIDCTTLGYVEIAELYANSNNDAQLGVYYTVLSSAETDVTFTNATAGTGFVGAYVWRGVNQSTPLDVTPTTITGNTSRPNCPSITTVTNNCIIVAIGIGVGSLGTNTLNSVLTVPSGMTNFTAIQTGVGTDNDIIGGFASFLQTTAGAYDPATFGGGNVSTLNSFCGVTIALRRA